MKSCSKVKIDDFRSIFHSSRVLSKDVTRPSRLFVASNSVRSKQVVVLERLWWKVTKELKFVLDNVFKCTKKRERSFTKSNLTRPI